LADWLAHVKNRGPCVERTYRRGSTELAWCRLAVLAQVWSDFVGYEMNEFLIGHIMAEYLRVTALGIGKMCAGVGKTGFTVGKTGCNGLATLALGGRAEQLAAIKN
jgi:hypothetical protein